jgi:hypothetical protein
MALMLAEASWVTGLKVFRAFSISSMTAVFLRMDR